MAVILFLLAAAAYDYKYREIPGWIYAVGGTLLPGEWQT